MPAVPWHICCILRRRALRHCCALRPLAPLLWPTRCEGPRPDPTTKRLQPSPAIPEAVCASCTALLLRHPSHSNTKGPLSACHRCPVPCSASIRLPNQYHAFAGIRPSCGETGRQTNTAFPCAASPVWNGPQDLPCPAFPDLPLKSEEEGKPGLPFLLSSTAVTVHHRRCLILSA